MTIDFGSIRSYNPKGFGFVSHTFSNPNQQVFFHIKKIRQDYPDLSQKLDNGEVIETISFWYEIEDTQRGKAVSRIWLNVDKIPQTYRNELNNFIQTVESIWDDLSISIPSWLDSLTRDLLGPNQLRELRAKRDRKNEIKRICQEIGIENLIHFTHTKNLISILEYGLIGRSQLQEKSLEFRCNDELRLDKQPQAICLSISFPNYKMFYKYRTQSDNSSWVVLLLDPSILWKLDCKFYIDNAASVNARNMDLMGDRRSPSALKEMFENYGHIERADLAIPGNFTTHPQAEVLVFDEIDPHFIREVMFYSLEDAQQWVSLNPGNYLQDTIISGYICRPFDKYYFSPREDWEYW